MNTSSTIFKPIKRLLVHRTLCTGLKIEVGEIAQNSQGIFFQYSDAYLKAATLYRRST